jgi:hypothetical protein
MVASAAALLTALRDHYWAHAGPADLPRSARDCGPLLGVDPDSCPADYREGLADAGTPFSTDDGVDFSSLFHPGHEFQILADGRLALPPPERLRAMTSLPLKPLRLFNASRFKVRLQVGTGVHLFLGPAKALCLNTATVDREGFLHGPDPAHRTAVAMMPGELQVVHL